MVMGRDGKQVCPGRPGRPAPPWADPRGLFLPGPEAAKRPAIKQRCIVLNDILRLVGQYSPLIYFGVLGAVPLDPR